MFDAVFYNAVPGISETVMSGSQKRRRPVVLWSLEQAAVWVEARADASDHPIHRRIAPTTVQELHEALKAGTITGSGCVDGGERRAISPAEWNDYRLTLKHVTFAGHHYMGSAGMPVIAVLSIRSFSAGALKHHGYRSGVQIPSAQSPVGEPGYHRVIDDVLLRPEEVVKQWPAFGRAPVPDDLLAERARSRPKFEGALRAIGEIYPDGVPDQATEPNFKLCQRVSEKLKGAGLSGVSDDTILRAAGRRRT
jgi:hypothetical protein